MGKKKKKQTRAEPKTTLSWLCSNEAFETLCCQGYTKLSDNPEIISAVNNNLQSGIQHDNTFDGKYSKWRQES